MPLCSPSERTPSLHPSVEMPNPDSSPSHVPFHLSTPWTRWSLRTPHTQRSASPAPISPDFVAQRLVLRSGCGVSSFAAATDARRRGACHSDLRNGVRGGHMDIGGGAEVVFASGRRDSVIS